MYVCMHVCVYVCMYVCMYVSIYTVLSNLCTNASNYLIFLIYPILSHLSCLTYPISSYLSLSILPLTHYTLLRICLLDTAFFHLVRSRVKTFPRFLAVVMARYMIDYAKLIPVKVSAQVDVPRTLDLSFLRATGPQPGEVLVDKKNKKNTKKGEEEKEFVPNAASMEALTPMGFSENACKRALKATGK